MAHGACDSCGNAKEECECEMYCSRCGGTNVQIAMWVRTNTEEVLDDFGSFDETDTKWCEDCEAHVLLFSKDMKRAMRDTGS